MPPKRPAELSMDEPSTSKRKHMSAVPNLDNPISIDSEHSVHMPQFVLSNLDETHQKVLATATDDDESFEVVDDGPDDEAHKRMDEQVLQTVQDQPFIASFLLSTIASVSEGQVDSRYEKTPNAAALLRDHPNLKGILKQAWVDKRFRTVRNLRLLQLRAKTPGSHATGQTSWEDSRRMDQEYRMDEAYTIPFVGNGAADFVDFLRKCEDEEGLGNNVIYAKAVSMVQSSGTGKSRTLTEAGKLVFTLPICLRGLNSPGYPLRDMAACDYFSKLTKGNDLSLTAHIGVACFLAACHTTMLTWLKEMHERGVDGKVLLSQWHDLMERKEKRKRREEFFSAVVTLATSLQGSKEYLNLEKSPRRSKDNTDETNFNIEDFARQFYGYHARKATQDLVNFLSAINSGKRALCVTYVDEADELDTLFWVLLRLLSNQDEVTSMWYVFMATKSSINYFHPTLTKLLSLRLKDELKCLIPPYFALGFDQNVIANARKPKSITIGELQTLEHLCNYGRPLWRALFHREQAGIIDTACLKLTNGEAFNDQNVDHVLAILSQRLCIEPVLASSEAIELADRSVANHMRLLTGMSSDRRTFYTYSPSEPILVLGATNILYKTPKRWGRVLDSFSKRLCDSGLVEKGLIGELSARTLLLIARDFTAPKKKSDERPDLLQPVRLLDFLDQLFGNQTWCPTNHRSQFENAFRDHYVNFTHWIVTKDPLPEVADQQLVANLWARHAALQCTFNQESLDLLIPTYAGSMKANAIFEPVFLSGTAAQIKFQISGNIQAGISLRPIGISRDLSRPLPYLALLMELGNESAYKETGSKIQTTVPSHEADADFRTLIDMWITAVKDLDEYQNQRKGKRMDRKKMKTEEEEVNKKEAVRKARLAIDSYNRYAIFIRGASNVYGILKQADIVHEFATLLSVTMPSPASHVSAIQHMRPLERLGDTSAHTAWMSRYIVGGDERDGKEDINMEGLE